MEGHAQKQQCHHTMIQWHRCYLDQKESSHPLTASWDVLNQPASNSLLKNYQLSPSIHKRVSCHISQSAMHLWLSSNSSKHQQQVDVPSWPSENSVGGFLSTGTKWWAISAAAAAQARTYMNEYIATSLFHSRPCTYVGRAAVTIPFRCRRTDLLSQSRVYSEGGVGYRDVYRPALTWDSDLLQWAWQGVWALPEEVDSPSTSWGGWFLRTSGFLPTKAPESFIGWSSLFLLNTVFFFRLAAAGTSKCRWILQQVKCRWILQQATGRL